MSGARRRRPRVDGPSLYMDGGMDRLVDESEEQKILEEQRVECLGMSFESEDARRAYFLERLKEKLPELRKRHDFPLGPDGGSAADEDILRLSDPPYYTACPNPFLDEFVKLYGRAARGRTGVRGFPKVVRVGVP